MLLSILFWPVEAVTVLPLLALLSIKASTASWSILFSFLWMTSGALSSCNLFKRLLRLITLRYKSFKSEVAKRPPSNWTIGLKSGGITGTVAIIIHSGLILLTWRLLINLALLISFFFLEGMDSTICLSSSLICLARLMLLNSFLMASAPMPASNTWPYLSDRSW